MTEQIETQINDLSYKIGDVYGDYYSKQFNYAINNIQNNTNIETTHIVVDLLDLTINDDYKQLQINALKKDVKTLQEENKVLKEENKVLKEEIKELKQDNIILKNNNNKLTKQVNKLMRNHYNLVLWQAYKNVEYYIIQKVTG